MGIWGNRFSLLSWLFALTALLGVGCGPNNPTLTATPSDWDFGTTPFGSEVSQTVTLTNTSGYALQILDEGDYRDPQLAVIGLPIANLDPGQSAEIQLAVRASANFTTTLDTSLRLVFGGHAGGVQGNSSEGFLSLKVSGDFTSTAAPVCDPGPDGESDGVAEWPSVAKVEWSQAEYTCTTSQPNVTGTPCRAASACAPACCTCATDCATFTAQACVLGFCAPTPVVCELTHSLAGGPALCPDGGVMPSSVSGLLGFSVGGAGVAQSSTATITLAREISSACLGAGAGPGLSFLLAASTSSLQAGAFLIGASGTSALLEDPSQGQLTASSGYILVTSVSGGAVVGSFDVTFPGTGGEVWGTIDAAYCP